MNNDENVRQIIGKLTQSPEFAVEVANLGKKPEDRMTIEQWSKVAMSQPRLYAVIEAAEIVSSGNGCALLQAIVDIAYNNKPEVSNIANRCARLAWQAQQPLLGIDRLSRPIMGLTSGNLPPDELEKDAVRVRATASLLLDRIEDELRKLD